MRTVRAAAALIAALVAVRLLLGFAFQLPITLGPAFVAGLGMTHGELGFLAGAFLLPGLAVSLLIGALARRGARSRTLANLGFALLALGMFASAGWMPSDGTTQHAGSAPAALVAGRLVSGLGATLLLVLVAHAAATLPAGRVRALGVALVIIGWPLGIALGQTVQWQLAEALTGRHVFAVTGLAAIVIAMVFSRHAGAPIPTAACDSRLTRHDRQRITVVGLLWLTINGLYVSLLVLLPTHIMESGFSPADSTTTASLMTWTGLFGMPLAALLLGATQRPTLWITAAFFALAVAIAAIAHAPWITTSALITAGVGFAVATPLIANLPALMLPRDRQLAGVAAMYAWFFAGAAVVPTIVGLAIDHIGVMAALTCCAMLAVVGATLTAILAVVLSRTLVGDEGFEPSTR